MTSFFQPLIKDNYKNYHKNRFGLHMNNKENSLAEASYRAMNDCLENFMKEYKLELWNQYTIEFVYWIEKETGFKGFPPLKNPHKS